MKHSVHQHRWGYLYVNQASSISTSLIVPVGTQIVLRARRPKSGSTDEYPKGTIAEIVQPPLEGNHSYRVRFADGGELSLRRQEFSILKQVKMGPLANPSQGAFRRDLREYIIYECIVGSRAYGLDHEGSDTDRRGVYLPPADLQWSLYGVPEQLEYRESEECYWELQKFLVLALKGNPNILECLFTPLVVRTSVVGDLLLDKRSIFLSKLVYQTYNGYVMSQFKKLEQDLRTKEQINWKHAMHLIRLLLQGIAILADWHVPVKVAEHRSALLAIRNGAESWEEVNRWRLALHRQFEETFRRTSLPESPDYVEANKLLNWARRRMVEVRIDS
jgi:uncharacterized protein